jgi:parallel beta-helix repeat protein
MNFADVAGLRITGNYIHDFKRSPASKDHSDMIQFWTKNTDNASRDVVIRDNLLSSGTGLYTQSIFMRNDQVDRGLAGAEMFYRNITIENNTIINAHLHGITVGETDGLVIRNNTVVRNKSSKGKKNKPALWTPQIRVAPTARNVEITRNVTSKVVGHEQQAGWRVARNFFVQDTMETQPGFYGAVFGRASMNKPTSPASFTPKPGGPLHNANLGSSLFLPE